MNRPSLKPILITLILAAIGVALLLTVFPFHEDPKGDRGTKKQKSSSPVEVAAIERGPIELLRTFTGTLEAQSEFVAGPKVGGRVEQLHVDIADEVTRGQVVAVLDDAEYVQDVARAQADLDVAKASHSEAHSLLQIAERELKRLEPLQKRGDISESQLDAAKSNRLAKQAQMEVTQANIARAEAELEAARIRLGYTQVNAGWHGGSDQRVVAERYVDAGETVAANAPLLRIVELNPITAVFYITERDYARLHTEQSATLTTDAYPGEVFHGKVARIAPVFRETTRQARVELLVDNAGLRLKPGMFARATVVLDRVEEAVIIPEQALTVRDDHQGVFLVSDDETHARWQQVRVGIRQGDKVQLLGDEITGRVVTLGQQLLDDGSPLKIVESKR